MSLVRWIPTFLAFPLAGLLAMLAFGAATDPWAAAAGGALLGLIVGAAQWLALWSAVGGRRGWLWVVATSVGASVGSALGVAIAGSTTSAAGGVVVGAVAGVCVGLAQGLVLRRGVGVTGLWTGVVAGSWALGWMVTSLVIVDLDRGHIVFGASGAIVVALITGIVLRLVLGPRARRQAAGDEQLRVTTEAAR